MGQITNETIAMIRCAVDAGQAPPLTLSEFRQLAFLAERQIAPASPALLFEHEDGRYAVNPATTGDPKWHRLGPVEVFHPSTSNAVAQWQKRHWNIDDGKWQNTNEADAKWWRDNAKGWEIRALYAAPTEASKPVQAETPSGQDAIELLRELVLAQNDYNDSIGAWGNGRPGDKEELRLRKARGAAHVFITGLKDRTTKQAEAPKCSYPQCAGDQPEDGACCKAPFTSAMGDAAERYWRTVGPHAHPLPAQFRWVDCFRAMEAAATKQAEAPTASKRGGLPFAVFDEFGQSCEDRVADHYRATQPTASNAGERPWIKPSERLPEDETIVLAMRKGKLTLAEIRWEHPGYEDSYQAFRFWCEPDEHWISDEFLEEGVDCWMPISAALAQVPEQVAGDSEAARDVLAERRRQISVEGWTPEHDDEHTDGSMAHAAAAYAVSAGDVAAIAVHQIPWRNQELDGMPDVWPASWDESWWKPSTPRRSLVKAGALILAEIERLDRAARTSGEAAK